MIASAHDPMRVCHYTAQQIVVAWSLHRVSIYALSFMGCKPLVEGKFEANPFHPYYSSVASMQGLTASQAALCCAHVLACWKADTCLACCAAVCPQAGSLPTGDDRFRGLLNLRRSAQVDHRAD